MSVEIKEIELWIKTTPPCLLKKHSVPGALKILYEPGSKFKYSAEGFNYLGN